MRENLGKPLEIFYFLFFRGNFVQHVLEEQISRPVLPGSNQNPEDLGWGWHREECRMELACVEGDDPSLRLLVLSVAHKGAAPFSTRPGHTPR